MNTYFSWQHAIRAAKIEPLTKLVLYTIATRMAADGSGCFPSYNTIADESGLCRRAVITHVSKAVELGLVRVIERRNKEGKNQSNLYKIVMPLGGERNAPPSAPHALPSAPDAPPPSAPHAPITTHSLNYTLNTPLAPQGGSADGFEKFWKAYPKKIDFGKAIEAWESENPPLEDVLKAIENFRKQDSWLREGGRFIPSPTKWLRRKGWLEGVNLGQSEEEKRLAEQKLQELASQTESMIERAKRERFEKLTGKKYDAA